MKKIIYILLLCCPIIAHTQTIEDTIMHDDIERAYRLYVPDVYTGNSPVPLVLNFHGYGSNSFQQEFYTLFNVVADTANIIVVYPNGTLDDDGNYYFNAGFTPDSTVDDVGFTAALIDSLSAEYNIDPNRIYSTGMSNGGFMSYLLACQLSDRIAAIASVTGTMVTTTVNNCNSQRPVPAMQIHGTQDAIVNYNGSAFFLSMDELIEHWVNHNNCNTTPTVYDIPDINTDDGSTVEHRVYRDGDAGVNVEFFSIDGGGHTWPGAPLNIGGGTNRDINASYEIWKFFSKYDLNGTTITDVEEIQSDSDILIYPNPTNSLINIQRNTDEKANFELVSALGETVSSGILQTSNEILDISQLPTGVYFLKFENHTRKVLICND